MKEHCKTVVQLFEERVTESPNKIAVRFGNQKLTYCKLNNRANQLAHFLRKKGVGIETLVTVCLERSLDMIICVLGILKAGGAYVPIDSSYPLKRIEFILKDTKSPVLITNSQLSNKCAQYANQVITLDQDEKLIASESIDNPVCISKLEHLAYVVYTSGSTGVPKGVLLKHMTLANLISWQSSKERYVNPQRISQFASINFDVSLQEIFYALSNGYELHIVPSLVKNSLPDFVRFIKERKINQIFLPTSFLTYFANYINQIQFTLPDVKKIIVAGEALIITPEIQNFFLEHPEINLVNQYGPSEAHVVTEKQLLGNPKDWQKIPSIGKPIVNTQIYVLNEQQKIVPTGQIGELYIGGVNLAKGYLNQPGLTKEKFIYNPFDDGLNNKLYKTGDLARWLPDGDLEFIGRSDNQIKIRGYRVELNEVESILDSYPLLSKSVALAKDDTLGNKYLVGYLICKHKTDKKAFNLKKLLAFLSQQIPDFMIPSVFIMLDDIPLTPNGKIDRKALSERKDDDFISSDLYIAPRTKIEKKLTELWSEILNIPFHKISVNDNFFVLGGHSLLTIKLLLRLNADFLTDLTQSSIFTYPTIQQLADVLNRFSKEKKQIERIKKTRRKKHIPLSQAQEQIWIHQQMSPNSPIFNEPMNISMNDEVNIKALENSLNAFVKRHDILRANFSEYHGQIVQDIMPFRSFKLPFIDLRHLSEDQRELEAIRIGTEQAKQLFDVSKDTLTRFLLIQLEDKKYKLFITFHHLIMDAVTMVNIFISELEQLYQDQISDVEGQIKQKGREKPLLQYADYAIWQREQTKQQGCHVGHFSYWQRVLSNLPILKLPTMNTSSLQTNFNGHRVCLRFPIALTQSIKRLGQKERTTPFIVLLTAFNILLHRYTDQTDIPVGSVVIGRHNPDTENMVGDFLNTLIFRNDLSNNPTFEELLKRIHKTTIETYQHQEFPFQEISKLVHSNRSVKHQPIQVALVMEPNQTPNQLGWKMSQLEIHTGTTKFDLTFGLDEEDDTFFGRVEYKTDLFDEAFIKRMIEHFKNLLSEAIERPTKRIGQLDMLTSDEMKKLLVDWNDTKTPYAEDKTIVQLFEEQVLKTPDNIALRFKDQILTYRELNQKANQLAHYLKQFKIKNETPITLYTDRSLCTIIGIFGILKTGGFYVPIDSDCPEKRFKYILEESQSQVLLTQEPLMNELNKKINKKLPKIPIVLLDKNWSTIAKESVKNLISNIKPNNLIYTIYTSGSTGNPKGVMVTHQNVINYIGWFVKTFDFQKYPQMVDCSSPISFDLTVTCSLLPLTVGASIVICDQETKRDSLGYLNYLDRQNITYIKITPSYFKSLLQFPDQIRKLKKLKWIILGGEAINKKDVKTWLLISPQHKLVNEYGPTETTVAVIGHIITKDNINDYPKIPIGLPAFNTQVYVLNKQLQLLPIEVEGELYIGGTSVSRGYFNNSKLTAEKFISNPFSHDPNDRLYKTGDLVRWLPDGNLEYIGRIDDQVKIRGFRVELGEVEKVLSSHYCVKECVTIVREDDTDQSYLTAYLVMHEKEERTRADIIALRQFLRQQLPDYMIPATITFLDEFPLTPSGKIDRKGLPDPDHQHLVCLGGNKYTPPKTKTEKKLVKIWQKILPVKHIGIYDNFFDLGGHSILAVQAIVGINRAFGIDLKVGDLFHSPTIAELSVLL